VTFPRAVSEGEQTHECVGYAIKLLRFVLQEVPPLLGRPCQVIEDRNYVDFAPLVRCPIRVL
jgi:hypothetical protein